MKMGQPNAKSDSRVNRPLSSTTKCDQNHIANNYEFDNRITPKVGAKHDLLFNEPASAY